jgi:hypothetical protein
VIVPLLSPPVGAVYVNVIVLPLELAITLETELDIVPEPSAAFTVTLGELLIAVSVPALVDFWRVDQVCAPVDDGAAAPVEVLQAPEVAP